MSEPESPEPRSFHMSPEEFRRQGHAVVDWIADYHSRIESFPVLSRVRPGEIRSKLPPAAPEHGEAFDQILSDIDRVILPGITHWQSPNFYAYFPANASGPAILGDLLSSGLGVQGMLWSTSPACTERARLAGADAWSAGKISFDEQHWRRRDSRHGVERLAMRPACGPRAYNRFHQQSQRLRWTAHCLLLHANPLLDRKGTQDRGHGFRKPAPYRSG